MIRSVRSRFWEDIRFVVYDGLMIAYENSARLGVGHHNQDLLPKPCGPLVHRPNERGVPVYIAYEFLEGRKDDIGVDRVAGPVVKDAAGCRRSPLRHDVALKLFQGLDG